MVGIRPFSLFWDECCNVKFHFCKGNLKGVRFNDSGVLYRFTCLESFFEFSYSSGDQELGLAPNLQLLVFELYSSRKSYIRELDLFQLNNLFFGAVAT